MTSCPELCQRTNYAEGADLSPLPDRPRRNSRSQPPTPSSLARLVLRFRSARVWRSIGGGSSMSYNQQQPAETQRFIDGEERRRIARESKVRHSSGEVASQGVSPEDGTSPLTLVGMRLAMEELERLSGRMRTRSEEAREAREARERTSPGEKSEPEERTPP